MQRVHVVIPVHNNWNYTRSCLRCLQVQNTDITVTIVDDGSSDDTAWALASQYPWVRVVPGDGNLWWAASMNRGIEVVLQHADPSEFVLSLNNDTWFEPDLVGRLLDNSRSRGRAVVGANCQSSLPGASVIVSGVFCWSGRHHHYFKGAESPDCPDFLTSRAVLYPVDVFNGGRRFNATQLPQYHSDLEFTARLKRAGFSLGIERGAILQVKEDRATSGIHHQAHSGLSLQRSWSILTSRRSAHNLRDMFRLIDLCGPREHRWRHKFHFLLFALRASLA